MLKDSSWTILTLNNSGLPDNTVLSITSDKNSILWMALPAAGIVAYDGLNWQYYSKISSNNPSNSFNDITFTSNGNMYAASKDTGLVVYTGGTNWTSLNMSNSELPENDLLCLETDFQDNVWIGTASKGLVQLGEVKEVLSTIEHPEKSHLNIYPNPAKQVVHIQSSAYGPDFGFLQIIDLRGQIIKEVRTENYLGHYRLAISDLNPGIYILKIKGERGEFLKKLVKQ